jgi:anti-anti-sigma factor
MPESTQTDGVLHREEVAMASNPVPSSGVRLTVNETPTDAIVQCSGRITSDSSESLKATVKPLFSAGKFIVLDLSNVSYLDSSGLGTIVGLYVSAKRAKSELKIIHLNERLKELISLTRLGEFLTEGRDPSEKLPP